VLKAGLPAITPSLPGASPTKVAEQVLNYLLGP
jgi:hypothetical protein